MEKQPAEIEERFVQQIVQNHMKMRRWTKRLLVISTIVATILIIVAIHCAIHGQAFVCLIDALFAGINIANANQLYRKVI